MILNFLKNAICITTLLTFVVGTCLPIDIHGTYSFSSVDRDAIFGRCRYKRIKKKAKRLVNSVEGFKKGEKSIDEVNLQLNSLKNTASKAFSNNLKVQEIMDMANHKIDEFLERLLEDAPNKIHHTSDFQFAVNTKTLNALGLIEQYESIQYFLANLYEYESNQESIQDSIQLFHDLTSDWLLKSYHGTGSNNLDEFESKVLFAYVSIFCGCLLAMIPTPLTEAAGASLISGGLYVLGDHKFEELDNRNHNH